MSLSIQETDSNLFLFYPKSNDLEIKFYNPAFWESLGFQGISVSVVKTPTLTPTTTEDASGSVQTGGSPGPSSHSVSFPYNQFVFLLKGNPEQPSRVDTVLQQYATTQSEAEKRPAGLYGVFFPMLDGIYKTLFAKSKEEPAPAPAPAPEPAPVSDTTSTSTSMFSGLMPTQKTETQTAMPSMNVSLPDVSKQLEMKPTEVKEPPKSLYSSLMEYVSPAKQETQPVPPPPETIQPVVSTQPIQQQETQPVLQPVSPPETQPVLQPPETQPVLPPPETQPVAEPTQPVLPPPETQPGISPEIPKEQTEIEKPIEPQPSPEVVPIVSVVPISEPEKTETEPTVGQLFWKLVIPKLSNPPKVFEPSEIAEKYEQHFRDVLLQSRMETKSGIYVAGSFYSVLGRKVKIGTVEPSNNNKHTLRDYLQTVPELEGSIMSKYKKMLANHNL